jgi:hypothetical protein
MKVIHGGYDLEGAGGTAEICTGGGRVPFNSGKMGKGASDSSVGAYAWAVVVQKCGGSR